MRTYPLVSIVLPVLNVAPFLGECVWSAYGQDWPLLELVAIDDGSEDGSGSMLDALAVRWTAPGRSMRVVHQPNAGAAAARNAGLDLLRGDYVCFLDGDDRLHPTAVSRLVEMLRGDPALALVAPRWRYVDAQGVATGTISTPRRARYTGRDLVVEDPLDSASGVMVPARVARETGSFDTELSGCIDLDWFVRAVATRGEAAAILPEPLVDYRKRAGQITSDWRRMRENWETVVAKLAHSEAALSPAELSVARGRNAVFHATVAYQAGEYSDARALIWLAWRLAPRLVLRDPHARIRTLAACASLLPEGLHATLRRRVNG